MGCYRYLAWASRGAPVQRIPRGYATHQLRKWIKLFDRTTHLSHRSETCLGTGKKRSRARGFAEEVRKWRFWALLRQQKLLPVVKHAPRFVALFFVQNVLH